jgi:hypothetical protein
VHRCAAHIAPAAQLYVCSDAGCTALRVDSSGVYTCTEGVISPVQLYGSSDTVPIETFHINFAVSGAFWKYLVHDTFLLCMD